MEAPKIALPEPKPEPKPVEMEAKVNLPAMKARPQMVTLAPQPRSALTAAMPAQNSSVKASTAPVHLGQTFGVMPNPNATRPATVASIGNPYGGLNGRVGAPHGVVGSTGIGNGTKSGSNAGTVGRVASAGIPGASGTGTANHYGHVASAGIPAATPAAAAPHQYAEPVGTSLQVLSKPPVQYTSEARQLRVQGNVVLRVTFTASGQVIVHGVVHGLGHGLDEEAWRVAAQIHFRPATRNGQPVDTTTTITISFQLA
jgi:TonB family protein